MLSPEQIQQLGERIADAAIESYFEDGAEIGQALMALAFVPADMLYELCLTLEAWQAGEGPLSELLYAWGQVATGEVCADDRIPVAL
jgi:hypothetical protein